MSVIIASGVFDVSLPRIGWHVASGAVAATNAVAGYEAARAAAQQTYDGWRPSSLASASSWLVGDISTFRTASYMGIAAHDLGSLGIALTIQKSDDASTWTDVVAAFTPADDSAIFVLFPPTTARFFRVALSKAGWTGGDALPTLGHIRFGEVLTVPRLARYTGTPIDEAQQVRLRYNLSQTGEYLGNVTEGNGLSFRVEIEHLSETFRRGDWRAFRNWAEAGNTFFIAPKPADYPDEVAYAWTSRANVERAIPNRAIAGSVSLDCTGYLKP